MDIATLIGLVGAFGIVIAAMVVGGDVGIFINLPSLLIVVLGSIMVVLMKFGLGQFLSAAKIAVKAFVFKIESPEELIEKAVELATVARKDGVLALENVEINNTFLKNGVQYLVDGLEPETVKATMLKDMHQTVERHTLGQKIFKQIGDVGPAMGMIGTLIGLVQMLSNMADPKSIGPAMAVALLTTLYGAMLANMIAMPIADKLSLRSQEEFLTKSLMIDAVMGIQQGMNPRVIGDLLKTYLPGSKRNDGASDGAAAESG
jgi:chemotaxis protein MotA